jgi:glutathione S-transferase
MYHVIGALNTRSFRVVWMLEELGQPYTLDGKRPHDAVVTALNPSGKVPVLIDGDAAISDSVAICQYLADKHGQMTFKAGSIDRAQQDSFTQFAVDEVEGPLWVAAKHTFVLPAEYRVEEVKRACRFDFDRAMATFSKRLGSKTYVTGDMFMVPDLILGNCLNWAAGIKWRLPDGNVSAYLDRIRARPAFQKVMAMRNAA